MSAIGLPPLAGPRIRRFDLSNAMPAGMVAMVALVSLVILGHLAVVLWLSWTSATPGAGNLAYTTKNFSEVFSDPRTYSVLLDTCEFGFVTLIVALLFGIP